MIKKLALIMVMIILPITSYFYGYYINCQNYLSEKYDSFHLNLSGEIMIYDAIVNGNGELAIPVILSMISSDFANLVELHNMGQKEVSKLVRCAVTRKIRVLKHKGIVFSGDKSSVDWGDKLVMIDKYMLTECLGEPSHYDWSDLERKKREAEKEN